MPWSSVSVNAFFGRLRIGNQFAVDEDEHERRVDLLLAEARARKIKAIPTNISEESRLRKKLKKLWFSSSEKAS